MAVLAHPGHRFRLVVAVDRSEYSEIVLEHAIDQAARHDRPDLHFITVATPDDDLEGVKTWLATEVVQILDTFGRGGPDWRSRIHVVVGTPEDEIASFAADLRADLIVIGRFGVNLKRGSIADRVLARAPCPTLVVGVTQHEIDPAPQCPACVELRESSDGARWFCPAHVDTRRARLSVLLPQAISVRG